MTSFFLTANHLLEGQIVHYAGDGVWREDLGSALLADDAAAKAELEAVMTKANRGQEVVGAYLVEVEREEGGLRPVALRERRRLMGPSIAYGPAAQEGAARAA